MTAVFTIKLPDSPEERRRFKNRKFKILKCPDCGCDIMCMTTKSTRCYDCWYKKQQQIHKDAKVEWDKNYRL